MTLNHDKNTNVNLTEIECKPNESENECDKWASHSESDPISWRHDGLYSWLVCAACFLVNAVIFGTSGTISMLIPLLMKLYQSAGEHQSADSAAASASLSALDTSELVASQVSLIAGLNYGCLYVLSLAVPPFVERYGCRLLFLVGVVLSLAGCLVPGVWPQTSLWIWWLFYGVAFGTGSAILGIVPAVVLEQSFERRFGLANAIQWTGSSFGWIVMSVVRQLSINYCDGHLAGTEAARLSLSISMYISAGLMCLVIALFPLFGSPFNLAARRHAQSLLLITAESISLNARSPANSENHKVTCKNVGRGKIKKLFSNNFKISFFLDLPVSGLRYGTSESERTSIHSESSGSTWRQSISRLWIEWKPLFNANVLIYIIVGILYQLGSGVPDCHWVMFAELKFPEQKSFLAAAILLSNGVPQVPSKLLVGWLADKFGSIWARATLYGAGILVKGFATSFVPSVLWIAPQFATVIALNLAYGAGDSVQCTADIALLQRMVGSERFGRAFALTTAASGVGVLLSPSLGGLAYDLLASYDLAFALTGTSLAASSLLLFLIRAR